jgi:YhcH/YjgK/YiaL family protein
MILDQLSSVPSYFGLDARLVLALQFLRQTDLTALSVGRYPIDEERVFALVSDYDTKPAAEGVWEAHRQHVDVQYVAAGEERIGCAPLEAMNAGPYDAEKDVLFAQGSGGDFVTLRPGRFVVLFPQDAHMSGMALDAPQRVKKIVVKVRLS